MRDLRNTPARGYPGAPSNNPCQATVLCIDDDPEIPRAVGAYLAGYGIEVLKAFHGTHGLELARWERPDAILIDQSMPQGDGDTIIGCLKRDPQTREIPVLVLTGRRDQKLKDRLIGLGVERFLTKPVRFDDLWNALRPFITIRKTPVGRTSICESNDSHSCAERDL